MEAFVVFWKWFFGIINGQIAQGQVSIILIGENDIARVVVDPLDSKGVALVEVTHDVLL